MKRILCAVIAASFLNSCATEWQTDRPVTPITYHVPAYRAERSVGNLRRLVILPVRVRRVGAFAIVTYFERMDAGLTFESASYLSERKGYEVVPVIDVAGVWRPEVVLTDEFGSVGALKSAWEQAHTEIEIEDAVKKIGRALKADGVVSIWLEELDQGFSVTDAVLIPLAVFPLFLTPGFYGALHVGAEAVVYEVLSGQAVWRNQFSGATVGVHRKKNLIVTKFFEDLENAIPAQLVR